MENKIFYGIVIAIAVLLQWGCVKDPQDIPPGLTTDPVFGFAGVVGTQAVSIDAGISDWTVQPGIEFIDSTLVYKSLFSLDGCTDNCAPSYEFRFYSDAEPGQDHQSAFEKTIHTGSLDYVGADVERQSFDILLSTHPGLFMSGHSYWTDLNILETFYLSDYGTQINYEEELEVCFQSLAFTGCNYSQCISFDPATLVPCLSYIEAELVDDRYLKLEIKPEGTAPFQVLWGNGSTAAGIIIPLQDPAAEVYADVTVTDANGNSSNLKQSVKISQGNVDACYFPIELSSTPSIDMSPEFAAGKVEIIYTDQAGEVWRSTAGVQTNATFFISDISYYGLSPDDQPAYKTTLSVVAQLFNELTGESRQLVIQQAVIALAHP